MIDRRKLNDALDKRAKELGTPPARLAEVKRAAGRMADLHDESELDAEYNRLNRR